MLAVGFTVKSGWTAAVLIAGARDGFAVVESRRLEISDPEVPDGRQPYHAGFGTAREAGEELRALVRSVKSFGRRSIARWLRDCAKHGKIRGAGIVVGSLIDPATIANDHIRIHAMEGQLFRGVVIDAAEKAGLRCAVHRERDLFGEAARRLRKSDHAIRAMLTEIGKVVDGGWRAEQKMAALAAGMELS